MTAAAWICLAAALIGLGFWLYGIHVRTVRTAVSAAEARGYQRRAMEGVAAGFEAGWHPGTTRGAR